MELKEYLPLPSSLKFKKINSFIEKNPLILRCIKYCRKKLSQTSLILFPTARISIAIGISHYAIAFLLPIQP